MKKSEEALKKAKEKNKLKRIRITLNLFFIKIELTYEF